MIYPSDLHVVRKISSCDNATTGLATLRTTLCTCRSFDTRRYKRASTNTASSDFSAHEGAVLSPMVGTVYLAPEPGAADFINEGDVEKGQTLFIVEAMKVMNPITAPTGGKVTKILVENAQPIEFDQPLAIIE